MPLTWKDLPPAWQKKVTKGFKTLKNVKKNALTLGKIQPISKGTRKCNDNRKDSAPLYFARRMGGGAGKEIGLLGAGSGRT